MSTDHTHPLVRLETLALIAVGGVTGASLRHLVDGAFPEVAAVLLVNVVGSALLGFVTHEAVSGDLLDRRTRVLLTTGFCSSLTTYSAFAVQTALAGSPLALVAVVAGNYGLGVAAVVGSRALARRVLERDEPTAASGGETA
ncbi:fluoride efflux transporter FluC [Natrialbaceae archaeon GCM10025810]|uniref:fluoride efflux transporter FluC n=1 Tax=Halovalidus salilacus TaxID=3075124 RepID=UPI00360FE79B